MTITGLPPAPLVVGTAGVTTAQPAQSLSLFQQANSNILTLLPANASVTLPAATDLLAGLLDSARATIIDNLNTKNPNLQTTPLAAVAYSGNYSDVTGGPSNIFGIAMILDGGGNPIPNGLTRFLQVPFNATITGWTVLADVSGSISVDIWKAPYANYPPTVGNSIVGGVPPSITSGINNASASLGAWSTLSVTAGDVIGFHVTSNSTITVANVILTCTH